jgi:hypothetical protein
VDVGINVVDGHIRGDVDFESARQVASAITPVPGGVGPLTNALLLAHLVRAAQAQSKAKAKGSIVGSAGRPSPGGNADEDSSTTPPAGTFADSTVRRGPA